MNYLFFDIECANCFNGLGKICEFGYVLVDKDFQIIEQDNIVINPNSNFDWFVLKKMLAYKESDYVKSPTYPYFYEKIKSLFNKNTLVFGHTVDADAKYLNDENKRYNLKPFDYTFYDVMYIYRDFTSSKDKLGLTKITNAIGCNPPVHEHRALDDAFATMSVLKSISEKAKLTPKEIVKLYPSCWGNTINGTITTIAREQAKQLRLEKMRNSNKMTGEKYSNFMKFLDNVKPEGEIVKSILNGKKLAISLNYQNTHFLEMINMVQLLKNHNCEFTLKATKSDYFVRFDTIKKDGSKKLCSRYEYVKEANKKGADIKILNFDELLKILDTTEEELHNKEIDKKYLVLS